MAKRKRNRDLELLGYLKRFIGKNGYSPSYGEMCEGIGLKSKGSIHNLIQRLKEAGKVDLQKGSARTIRLT